MVREQIFKYDLTAHGIFKGFDNMIGSYQNCAILPFTTLCISYKPSTGHYPTVKVHGREMLRQQWFTYGDLMQQMAFFTSVNITSFTVLLSQFDVIAASAAPVNKDSYKR